MKKNLILATAALLTINLATGAIAWAEPAPAKPAVAAEKIAGTPTKLPGYDQKTRVMVHKSAWANPLCKIDKDSLTAAVNKSILGHGNYLTPTVFFVAPHALPGSTKVLSAYEYGDTLAKAWAKQGLPDSSVVVVALCDATSVKVATVINGSLVPYLDVNDLKAKEGALRATANTNPTGYAAGVVEYLANAVETKQALIKQAATAQAQAEAARKTQLAAEQQRQRQTALAAEQQRQAALAADQQRQRQAALAAEQQRQTALAAERQRQAALAANQQRQAAPTASNSSNSNVGLIIMVVVLSLTVLGIILYLVLRRKDDETPATTYSGSNGGSNRNVGNYTGERRAEGSNRAVGHHKTGHATVRQPAPTNRGGVYQNYNWGGRNYSVMEQDLYGYVPAGVPQSSTGFWLKNIASMVAVYGIMEWLFDNGRRNEALSMGYVPGLTRDAWVNSQIAQHHSNLWAGNDYYHAPLMNHDSWGNNSWNGNLDNFAVTQANANDGWDVGATQAQPENLVLGDDSPTDQANAAVTQANAEDGWDVGSTTSDNSQLVLGDDDNQASSNGQVVLGDDDSQVSDNDQVVLGDDDQSEGTGNDPYQVSLGDGEPEAAATDNDYQVALGDDQPEAETGSNDGYQSSFGNDETEETGGNDGNYQLTLGDDEPEEETVSNDYQSSFGNDEPEAPAADNDDYQSDVSDSNNNDDGWS